MATRQEKIEAAWFRYHELEMKAYDALKEYKKAYKEAKDD